MVFIGGQVIVQVFFVGYDWQVGIGLFEGLLVFVCFDDFDFQVVIGVVGIDVGDFECIGWYVGGIDYEVILVYFDCCIGFSDIVYYWGIVDFVVGQYVDIGLQLYVVYMYVFESIFLSGGI